jgi:arylsulfatase A-like enzyme/Flp pilus assembly protein TadD
MTLAPATRKRPLSRILLIIAGLTVVASAAGWWWTREPVFTLTPRPDRNVLLVTIDTLRTDAMSVYGGRARTPNLEALAARGATFTFAHSHAVVTLPSHTSLLTGTYPYVHGVRDNNGYRVKKDQPTLATRLKTLGFATGAFVGGFPLDQRFGLNAGFDTYDDRIGEVGSTVDFALPERRADIVVGSAATWINAQQGKWFAWMHLFDPHAPYQAPEDFARRYPNDPYAAEITWTDSALGPILDRLASLSRPTLVIVTADHGESLGDHGEMTHGIFAYEATLRVPLLVAEIDPAGTPALGQRIDSPARHIDLLPTVLDAIGAPREAQLPGTSLLEAIAGRGEPNVPSYFEAMTANLSRGWAPLRGVIVGRDKYIDLPIQELYGLTLDPREQQNLTASQPARVEVLLNTLRSFDVAPPTMPGEETTAVRDRLRALGYVGGSAAAPKALYVEDDDPKRLIEVDEQLHRAGDLYQRGDLPGAAKLFQAVIDRRPDTADAYRYLAFVYWQGGKTTDAIATLEKALAHGISHRDVRVKLCIYLAETGQATRAVKLLEGLAGDDIESLNALGIAYGRAGRTADALKTFKHVLEFDPTNGLSWQNIGTVQLNGGDRQAAETSLRKAIEVDDTLAGAYTTLGVVLSESGRKADAVQMWMSAVGRDTRELDALYNLTVTLVELGRKAEARIFGQRYISIAQPEQHAADIARIKSLLGL